MGVNGIENTGGSNDGGFRDMAAQRHNEASFEQLLDVNIKEPKPNPDPADRRREGGGFEESVVGQPVDIDENLNPGDGPRAPDRISEIRQEALELRHDAETLRRHADKVEENGEGPHMRAVYLAQAESKEKDAGTKDELIETIKEDRRLNGGGPEDPVPVEEYEGVEEEVIPRDQHALPVEGWAPSEQVAAYSQELNAIEAFEGAEVTATREATDNEVEAFLDLAKEMGLEDLEFADGFLQAFPIQFVYVENLDQFGMDSATNGELMFDNKSIILVDSEFMSDDTTLDMSPAGDAAREAVYPSFGSIVDVMIEMEAAEAAATPGSTDMEALDESEDDEDSSPSTAAVASAPVSESSDIDGEDE